MSNPDPPDSPRRIDLTGAEDLRDVVHKAVADLAQGEGFFFSLPGVAGAAVSVLRPAAVEGLFAGPADPDDGPPTLLLRDAEELNDYISPCDPLTDRLARRGWPGPLTLVLGGGNPSTLIGRLPKDAARILNGEQGVAFQVPSHPFLLEVLRLLPGPLILRPMGRAGQTGDDLWRSRGFARVVESGAGLNPDDPTVARVCEGRLSVLRRGSIDEETLGRMAATILLFVCTGNTCRSPMAEALCKVLVAERVGCPFGELEGRGYRILSAGISAQTNHPAAANAVDVVAGRGGSLQGHKSRRLTHELIRLADAVFVMTADHLDTLIEHAPEAAAKVKLLHPQGSDVADPIGAGRETYEQTAREIESYLKVVLDDLGV
jgi:protein-tyrosine-phosphatase/tRNA A37 threonylcarbamoyladenosine synthetase subunit TsaC/SUA5/YrdC